MFCRPANKRKYPTTAIDENCVKFYFQTNRNYYVDLRWTYLVLKLKFVVGRVYEIYNTTEDNTNHKKEAKTDDETASAEDQEAPLPLITHASNILHSIFF